MSPWDLGSAPALKSPLMTDKDIIKPTRRKTCLPRCAHALHSANTHSRCVFLILKLNYAVALWQPRVAVRRNSLNEGLITLKTLSSTI